MNKESIRELLVKKGFQFGEAIGVQEAGSISPEYLFYYGVDENLGVFMLNRHTKNSEVEVHLDFENVDFLRIVKNAEAFIFTSKQSEEIEKMVDQLLLTMRSTNVFSSGPTAGK